MSRGVAALVFAWSLGFGDVPARAQEPPPGPDAPTGGEAPEVGPVVLANPLTGPGALRAVTCPSGRNKGEPVGEGYILKVTGKCSDQATIAAMPLLINDVVFPDGEIYVEVKVVSGHERAGFALGFRNQGESGNYQGVIVPAHGWAGLLRGDTSLVVRQDLAGLLARDDWNSVAVRARGPDLWLFVNEQLVGQATDPSLDQGRIFFALRRLGDPDDDPESAAVIRNLRISRLAVGDPERAPSIQPPGA